jgi:hypothetical protein
MNQRQKVVDMMKQWLGARQGDAIHREILQIYNDHRPLAQGYRVKPTDAWCMTTVSAAFIKAGLTDLMPTECSCPRAVELMKKAGIWQETDSFRPRPGDILFYDWQDTGAGDNRGNPDHVGIVETVNGNTVTVLEGNMGGKVGRRTLQINGKNIRGYGVPAYGDEDPHRAAVQIRFGFDDHTMAYLDGHPFAGALYEKLATKE